MDDYREENQYTEHDERNQYEEEIQPVEKPSRGGKWLLPISIVIAGAMISLAFIYSVGRNSLNQRADVRSAATEKSLPQPVLGSGNPENILPVTAEDHILGNPEAPIKIVVFADPECPFCRTFYKTMRTLMMEYGRDGNIAWVYRHALGIAMHTRSDKAAEALECANELGGNSKFWDFTDSLFQSEQGLGNLQLIAQEIGLDSLKFQECLNSNKYKEHVQNNTNDFIRSGGTGHPYTIIIPPSGQKFSIDGAQPYATVKQLVTTVLQHHNLLTK